MDALDSLTPIVYSGALWRTSSPNRDPLLGGTGGGRWSVPGSTEALYTSLEANTSLSELYYHLSTAPVFSSMPVQLCEIRANKLSVLDLRDGGLLKNLGIDDPASTSSQYLDKSRAIGAIAEFLEFHGIIVPSVRTNGDNLVLYPGNLDLNENLKVIQQQDINWPAWVAKRE